MKIIHNDEIIHSIEGTDVESIVNGVNNLISKIQESDRVVSEIFVDGLEITGELESYIVMNIDRIKVIDIRSVSTEDMFSQLMNDTTEYLKKLHQATHSISDLFYGDPDAEAWTYFSQLTEGLQFTVQSIQVLETSIRQRNDDVTIQKSMETFLRSLPELLKDLEQAVTTQDYVLTGDLIKYEIGDLVNELLTVMESKVSS